MSSVNLAAELVEWRADVRMMPARSGQRVAVLVYAWNWATNPARLRSDREAKALATFTRAVRRELATLPGWYFSDSGRMRTAAPAQGWDRIPGDWNGK